MMDVNDALTQACAEVGIVVPSAPRAGTWVRTDTFSGRNGKGDGSVKIGADVVFAKNFQTGETTHVRVGDTSRPIDRRKVAERIEHDRRQRQEREEKAARIAHLLVREARLGLHPYLARKGFPAERAPVLSAQEVEAIGGRYLVAGERAIVLPAHVGGRIYSAQIIWEDGTKKFLAGGRMDGASFRVSSGRETWVCEGFATGLSLRMALRSMNRQDGVVIAFSAYGVGVVAKSLPGRVWVATDNDKPMPQFDGLGTGEHWAREAGKPYAMPPQMGSDINDLHQSDSIFAVQRLLKETIRRGHAA